MRTSISFPISNTFLDCRNYFSYYGISRAINEPKTSQTTLAKARSICLTQTNLKVKRVKHEQF